MTGLRPTPGVGTLEGDGIIYAARLPDGPIVVLDGIAALIWNEACSGDQATIAERVAEVTDAAADDIRAHVDDFVANLVERRLLAPLGLSSEWVC
ncbi:PqqD family protein [Agromyces sp. Marseille-P2726]|uniref:PqqD family protein n=1 Tax=Agromyces sp. Marseille-P2726 TaxID=2709132 RepID=UPI00156E567C|nr:PqqD family protein [Agromyces sp. Marseille-P2726]